MSESVVQDAPPAVLYRAPWRKSKRLVGWLFLGLVLSILPLFVTSIMQYNPGKDSLLDIISNEDLLAVAFTLSGAAAVDVLVDGHKSFWKFLLGVVTFTMTLMTIAGYIIFKGHLTHLSDPIIITVTQVLYVATASLAFSCELSSET